MAVARGRFTLYPLDADDKGIDAHYAVDITISELDQRVAALIKTLQPTVQQIVRDREFYVEDVVRSESLFREAILGSGPWDFITSIELQFRKSGDGSSPALQQGDALQDKAEKLIALHKKTQELLDRYAAEMERDPDLRDALTRLLEQSKIDLFES